MLESQLVQRPFLVNNQMTIADIATFPWVYAAPWAGIDIAAEFPKVKVNA